MKLLRRPALLSSALTVEGYVHRATRGLPAAERLDAAAELRTHLLDRAAEHEAQGFSPRKPSSWPCAPWGTRSRSTGACWATP
ncbi:hypothetical protein [Deinococcus multiflagellatus]|uniref:Uncharacterized protein n=1 Tax=Deinococcus multiflagellatus TaxID=1656887 RepID=A0ABW1ZIY9_9DEIO